MTRKRYWWSDLPGERYWCEITDRDHPGDDLLCPQTQENGRPYWSYSLILQIRPGDVIYHYYTPTKTFVGASVAAGQVVLDKMSWVPHGTVGRKRGQRARLRPAWRLPLKSYVAASTPLLLMDVQNDEVWVRNWISEKQDVADVVAAPFQPYPGKLRGYQGYLTKMPSVFVNRWPRLKELADQLSGSSYVQELAVELQDDEAVFKAVFEDIRQVSGQGFHVSPKARRAIEVFAIERAKQHYEAQGYAVEVRGKPYDLQCSSMNEVLFVEVKGTTTAGNEILLTPNEVAFADRHSSSIALFVVSELRVCDGDQPIVSGGTDLEIRPWTIEHDRLIPVGYSYVLPPRHLSKTGG